MKYLLLLIIISVANTAWPQKTDTTSLKKLYDRCLDFDESKADSLLFFALFIQHASEKLHYDKGEVLSSRLRGIAHDLKGEYDKAIVYYLQSLQAARALHALNYETAALTDLAYEYVITKQPLLARNMYLESAKTSEQQNDQHAIINAYGNLGAIYNQLKLPDSALFYLNKGLVVAHRYGDKVDVSSFYSNLGNVYYAKKEYSRALAYFTRCYHGHAKDSSEADIWLDALNLADVFIEMKVYDSAYHYANQSLALAFKMQAKSKQADSYAMLAKLYAREADYKNAYEFQEKWYSMDTSLVNATTNQTIASLQEQFHARQRDQDNRLLQAAVEKAGYRTRVLGLLALAVAVIAVVITLLLLQLRRSNKDLQGKNDFINKQNERLAELNYEKNSLISVVSHDLSMPFAAIKMWLHVLEEDNANFNADQLKAVERIKQSSGKGEVLIRSILDIEKAGTNQRKVQLENFDLKPFVENILADFTPAAAGKNIQLHFTASDPQVLIVSDKQLLSRVCENLFSNAIKYSTVARRVWITLNNHPGMVELTVKDEGAGISNEDIPHLFSKYSRVASVPTAGEPSTGLGLSIVKRILDELNGSIACESEPGKGSLFTVVLKK